MDATDKLSRWAQWVDALVSRAVGVVVGTVRSWFSNNDGSTRAPAHVETVPPPRAEEAPSALTESGSSSTGATPEAAGSVTDLAGSELTGANVPRLGLNDLPVHQDTLGMQPYGDGLARFIASCPTPMTVAIQGDWGSGKTSTMHMVRRELEKADTRPTIVDFNMWQWAHGAMGDDPVYNLVEAILEEIAPPAEDGESRRILRSLARVSVAVSRSIADAVSAQAIAMIAGELGSKAYSSAKGAGAKEIEEIKAEADRALDVRAMFAKKVQDHLGSVVTTPNRADRIVIFVDDLDRLEPTKAVDVMEALKALLDCEGCVFVLAIDFEIVAQGVTQKYGSMGKTKAKSFFDKMIQLPFYMPVRAFATGSIVGQSLGGVDVPDNVLKTWQSLAALATDNNPRAIKRLMNSFILLREVGTAVASTGTAQAALATGGHDTTETQLFAYLSLRSGFPAFIEHLDAQSGAVADQMAEAAAAADDPTGDESSALLDAWDIPPDAAPRFGALVRAVMDEFGLVEGDGNIEQKSAAFQSVSTLAAVTSVSGAGSVQNVAAMTVMALEDRLARLPRFGVTEAQVRAGDQLERGLRKALGRQGLALQGSESSKGNEWSWSVVNAAEGSSMQLAKVYFTKRDTLTVVFGRRALVKGAFDKVYDEATAVAARHGWRIEVGKGGGYMRMHDISPEADMADLIGLLVDTWGCRSGG